MGCSEDYKLSISIEITKNKVGYVIMKLPILLRIIHIGVGSL